MKQNPGCCTEENKKIREREGPASRGPNPLAGTSILRKPPAKGGSAEAKAATAGAAAATAAAPAAAVTAGAVKAGANAAAATAEAAEAGAQATPTKLSISSRANPSAPEAKLEELELTVQTSSCAAIPLKQIERHTQHIGECAQ